MDQTLIRPMAVSLFALALCYAHPLAAQDSEQARTWCENRGNQFPATTAITGCNAIITDANAPPRNLSNAFMFRGIIYNGWGNRQQAIADLANQSGSTRNSSRPSTTEVSFIRTWAITSRRSPISLR